MKDELQGKLVEVLDSIQAATAKAGDFAISQLPDIAQQYVMYGRVRSAIGAIVFLLLAGALLLVARWAYKNPWNTSPFSWDRDKKRSDSNEMAMVVPPIIAVGIVITTVLSFDYLVWLAPKVWLIKELATLIR